MTRLSGSRLQELKALRRVYERHLPERIRGLEEAAAALASRWDAERLDALYHLAHRLVGSSAVYGFQALSAAAAALEAFAASAQEGDVPTPGERESRLGALVDDVKRQAPKAGDRRRKELARE